MKKSILTLALALSIAIPSAFAKPALRNYVHRVEQPDGSVIELTRLGDEFNHVTLTTDNIPVLADTQGRYCYAILDANGNAVASDIQAANPAERTPEAAAFIATINYEQVAEKILTRRESFNSPMRKSSASGIGVMEARFPHMGSPRALVLLVAFADKAFTVENAHEYYDRFLNGDTFTDYGATGSVINYFTTSSNGQFTPHFDVVGPLTLSNKTSYYGGNDSSDNDLRPCEMVREACTLANAEINFADYDTDGDGYVDNVYVIYAGQGEADYGAANTIWPHSWKLSYGLGSAPTYDGVKVDDYGCGNEWGLNAPDGIGTFVHEFSHVLGLPDLYCTNYNSSAVYITPGYWDVLDSGPYNNEGRTPPTYSIYARNAFEWIDPVVISGEATIDLRELQEYNEGAVILTSDPNEFFLLENRQQTGWDTYIPGHGMLIWHVDYDASVFRKNTVNNSGSHQYVDIEEACGKADSRYESTLAGYSFPGNKGVTSFTDDTKPSMVTWSGERLNLPITGITEENGIITFDVAGGYVALTAPVLASSAVTGNSFTISWAAVDKAFSYIVNVYSRDGSGNAVPVAGYSDFETTETSVTITRLQSETQYFATVVAKRNNTLSDVSDELSVTTAVAGFEEIVPIATAADNVTSGSFTANWQPVNNATSYILYVTRSLILPSVVETVDFGSGSTLSLPEGWESSSTSVYGSSSTNYYGDSAPALKFSSDGHYLLSPVYSNDVIGFSCWLRNAGSSTDNAIQVLGLVGSEWVELLYKAELNNKVGGETIDLTEADIPAGTHQIKVVFHKNSAGNMALDDVAIATGGTSTGVLDGYDHINVGNVTSYNVNTLGDGADYFYTIAAVNAAGISTLESDPITVKTPSFVSDIVADNVAVTTANGAIRIDAPAGTTTIVADCLGRVIATANGSATLNVANGIYVVNVNGAARKVVVK